MARRGCDPRKVRAFGPGLERGVVDQPNVFTVETKGSSSSHSSMIKSNCEHLIALNESNQLLEITLIFAS